MNTTQTRYQWEWHVASHRESHKLAESAPFLVIGGDVAPVGPSGDLLAGGRSEDVLGDGTPLLRAARCSLVNLECPLVEAPSPVIKCGAKLHAPAAAAEGLKQAGIDGVVLANNHIMDHGPEGLESTLRALEQAGIEKVGLTTPGEREPSITEVNVAGKELSVFALAEHEFNWDADYPTLPNPLRPAADAVTIRKRSGECDFLVVIVHGGPEGCAVPSPRMVETYRAFADAGADLVIGCHSHCMMGSEMHHGVPIVYGLGNFLFDRPGAAKNAGDYWNIGMLAAVRLSANNTATLSLIPTVQNPNASTVGFPDADLHDALVRYQAELSAVLADDDALIQHWEAFCAGQTPHFCKEFVKGVLAITPGLASQWLTNRLGMEPRTLFRRRFQQGISLLRGFAWCENHRDEWATILELVRKGRWRQRYQDRDLARPGTGRNARGDADAPPK